MDRVVPFMNKIMFMNPFMNSVITVCFMNIDYFLQGLEGVSILIKNVYNKMPRDNKLMDLSYKVTQQHPRYVTS